MQLFSYFTPLKHKNSFSDDFLTFSGGGGGGGGGMERDQWSDIG